MDIFKFLIVVVIIIITNFYVDGRRFFSRDRCFKNENYPRHKVQVTCHHMVSENDESELSGLFVNPFILSSSS